MYYYWFCFIIFHVVVTAQVDHFFVFSNNKGQLSKCIENELVNANDPYYREFGNAKAIADLAAKRFCRKSKTRRDFIQASNQFYYYLKRNFSHLFKNQHVYEPLRSFLQKVLLTCIHELQDKTLTVPIMKDELHRIGDVLDYILVDWPVPLRKMILTHAGRMVLRKYTHDSLIVLTSALNTLMDQDNFRYLLRSYWMDRAQHYFDGYNKRVPYLRHRYTLDIPFPHTFDNESQIFLRNAYNFLDRNHRVSSKDFGKIMYIHHADRLGYGEFDPFSVYESNGIMNTAEYYIEAHINQFYRILFFFMELQIRGITSDENDTYKRSLPYYFVPAELQAIVYNDHAYRNYLLDLRIRLESTLANNPQLLIIDGRHCLSSARVREEDLVAFLSVCISENIYIVSNSPTTSIPVNSTTTQKQQQLKKKGSTEVNSKGKHFYKKPRITNSGEQQQQKERNNGTRNLLSSGVYQLQLQQEENNNASKNLHNSDVDALELPLEELSFFTNTLESLLPSSSTNIRHDGM